jgi:phosphatidylserine decarboxylase
MRAAAGAFNFIVTNRIPRGLATRAFGWFSHLEQPWLARLAIAVWRRCSDLDLSDAKPQRYRSLHECFVRELRPGARRVDTDPDTLASPCDALVGAFGAVHGTQVWQAKGMPYRIDELFGSAEAAAPYREGVYVTLRLTAQMYHRFHAPHDATLEHVTYISGDAWNVNPPALARVPRLFCRNERAPMRLRLADGTPLALVPVAAVLVASIRLHAIDTRLHLRYRGPNEIACDVPFTKGQEMGWFEHGSTIVVFAPRGWIFAPGVAAGARLKMGEPLLRRLETDAGASSARLATG